MILWLAFWIVPADSPAFVKGRHVTRKRWFAQFCINLVVFFAQPLAQRLPALRVHGVLLQVVLKVLGTPYVDEEKKVHRSVSKEHFITKHHRKNY